MLDTILRAAVDRNATYGQYDTYQDYYSGRHTIEALASPRFMEAAPWVAEAAVENLCPAVVSAFTDRISVADWGTPDAAALGLDRLAALVHREAFISGNAFTITWRRPGTGQPTAVFHRAGQVIPIIDPDDPDRLRAAVKFWQDDTGHARATIYTDSGLQRWRTVKRWQANRYGDLPVKPAAWEPYDEEGQPHEEQHDFGAVPVCWWKREAASQFEGGTSILRDVISPQDRLNKAIADTVVASELVAAPIRYLLGLPAEAWEPRLNPTTGLYEQPRLALDQGQDSFLASRAANAGQFPGPDAASLVQLKSDVEAEISRVTGVPAYYLRGTSGDVPSGESLRVLTSRLTSAVQAFTRDATPVWRGQLELLGVTDPHLEWADAQPMDQAEKLANAQAKAALGYALVDAISGLAEVDEAGIVARAAGAAEQAEQATQEARPE